MGRPKQTSPQLQIKKSKAGLGLFAQEPIKKGQYIIEYFGPLLTNAQVDAHPNKYLFEVNGKWTIDGSSRKNTARYINHSCRPNCEPEIYGHRVKLYATKNIKAGEELAYDYGKEYWDTYIKPYGCRCVKCSGE